MLTLTIDDSKPLLGEVADDNGGEVDTQVSVGSKWKLKIFNREEAGTSNHQFYVHIIRIQNRFENKGNLNQ